MAVGFKQELAAQSTNQLVALWNALQNDFNLEALGSECELIVDELLTERGVVHERGKRTGFRAGVPVLV